MCRIFLLWPVLGKSPHKLLCHELSVSCVQANSVTWKLHHYGKNLKPTLLDLNLRAKISQRAETRQAQWQVFSPNTIKARTEHSVTTVIIFVLSKPKRKNKQLFGLPIRFIGNTKIHECCREEIKDCSYAVLHKKLRTEKSAVSSQRELVKVLCRLYAWIHWEYSWLKKPSWDNSWLKASSVQRYLLMV